MRIAEALLFANEEPLALERIAERLPSGVEPKRILSKLQDLYTMRGVHLKEINGRWAFRTAPDLAPFLIRNKVETRKPSRAMTEILGIVAYHQPVTRAEMEDIRGAGVAKGTLDSLIEIGWVKPGRRRETPGRPLTFVTTDAFLDHFGLSTVKDLPGLRELKEAGFLDSSGLNPLNETELSAAERETEKDGVADNRQGALFEKEPA